jgi:hypothetical protein
VVQEELQVQWENLEIMEEMGKLENLDFREFLVGLVLWVHLEIRDQLVTKDQKVLQVCQGHPEQEVIQEKMACLEELGHLDNLVLQEKEAYLEVQDQEVSRVCLVPLERMVCLEKMERLACRDHLEWWEMKECVELEDFLVKEGLLVWLDNLEQEENKDLQVHMGHPANLVQRELLVTRDQLV